MGKQHFSAQAELVGNYYQLRIADAQKQLLDRTVRAYEQLLQMAENRYVVGVSGRADIVLARTQFNFARTEAINAELARVKLEIAIAVLLGKLPKSLHWVYQIPRWRLGYVATGGGG